MFIVALACQAALFMVDFSHSRRFGSQAPSTPPGRPEPAGDSSVLEATRVLEPTAVAVAQPVTFWSVDCRFRFVCAAPPALLAIGLNRAQRMGMDCHFASARMDGDVPHEQTDRDPNWQAPEWSWRRFAGACKLRHRPPAAADASLHNVNARCTLPVCAQAHARAGGTALG